MAKFLSAWYRYPLLFVVLWPLSCVYRTIIYFRRYAYKKGWIKRYHLFVPVIVVGNLVVGGTGKTPMVIALVKLLREAGYKPGVITRGYGGDLGVQTVTATSDPRVVGDEAILIAQQAQCLVIKNKDRVMAARALESCCDVIISDDGLQHYRLQSDIKIAMQPDPSLQNFFCLPAGPWREPKSRLKTVDFVVQSQIKAEGIYPLNDMARLEQLTTWANKTVHAVCAIGAPWRFFDFLNHHGIKTINHAHSDHAVLTEADLQFADHLPVLITEKDAVKCKHLDLPNLWVVKITSELDPVFTQALLSKLSLIRETL